MPTAVNFNVQQSDNAKEFSWTETTGVYNASTNSTGWGTPNEATTDATAATLAVTDTSGTTTTIDLFAEGYPITGTTPYVITADTLGGTAGDQFEDGVYVFTYSVTTGSTTYTNTQTIFISGQARCCVYSMLCHTDACTCNKAELARAIEAYTYYKILVANALCGNQTAFEELLEVVNSYCDDEC